MVCREIQCCSSQRTSNIESVTMSWHNHVRDNWNVHEPYSYHTCCLSSVIHIGVPAYGGQLGLIVCRLVLKKSTNIDIMQDTDIQHQAHSLENESCHNDNTYLWLHVALYRLVRHALVICFIVGTYDGLSTICHKVIVSVLLICPE